ncbi:2-oxo acid dehydrogenase subunit E2 [Candidatus Bathyarchaeota archaeon]|nr:2-oxo acid dehydrogenase subunit E2 [Candidatus Bathyarchaeota archaeon]
MKTVIMPKLDLAMDSGEIVEWLKKEGETVSEGEPIANIMTQKVTYEVVSPASGVLYKILAPAGAEVPVGEPLAVILEPSDDVTKVEEAIRAIAEKRMPPELELKEAERASTEELKVKPERIKISPIAKKLAQEYNINIEKIRGTGPQGRIVKEDVLKAIEELKAKEGKIVPLAGVRKTIADRMALSHRTIPHVTISMDVDATVMIKLRENFEREGIRISYNAILVKAAAKALRDCPIFNSTVEEDRIRLLEDINIGLAVSTDYGLIVPVVRDADKKDIKEINSIIEDLVERARQNKLLINEVTGGTFTITNLGMFGVDVFTPLIVPGQVAILGVGRIAEKPIVINGQVRVKPMVTLSLSFDHRIIDGALAATFLGKIAEYLQNPQSLL